MSLIRIAFFVLLVLLLLPSNTYEKAEFHRTVERIGHDVGTFCDRNTSVCEQTTGFFQTLYYKLVTTVEMLEDLLRSRSSNADPSDQYQQNGHQHGRPQRQGYDYDNSRYPTAAMTAYSQNTLTSADLRPAWNGPKPWPSHASYRK